MLAHSANGSNLVSQNNTDTNSLFLYPKNPNWNIDLETLISTIKTVELIENPIADRQDCFFTGKQFLNHINFLGCAPTIQFNATGNNANFCFIRLIHSPDIKMIQTRTLARPPHCPNCKKPLKNWQEFTDNTSWLCPHCEHTAPASDYDWRRTAGYAHVFIEITDIFPKEAIPQPMLLEELKSHTLVEWDYFYYCA